MERYSHESNSKHFNPIYSQISIDLIRAIRWIISYQNHDGSWGNNAYQKTVLTSQIAIALSYFTTPQRYTPYENAVKYLKSIKRGTDRWYFRIPALLYSGDKSLIKDDIAYLENEFEDIELRFRASLVVDLTAYGISMKNFHDVKSILTSKIKTSPMGFIWFTERTDEDLLYALTICKLSEQQDQELIQKVIAWVISRKSREGNAVNWESSYGRTAYIAINLLLLEKEYDISINSLSNGFDFNDIFFWFVPKPDGRIPEDKQPAVFRSTDSLYTTALYIRMVGLYASNKSDRGFAILAQIVSSLLTKISKLWTVRRIFILLSSLIATFLTLFLLTYLFWGIDAIVSLSISAIASLLVFIFDIVVRNMIVENLK